MSDERTYLPDFNLWILNTAHESRERARQFATNNEHHAPVFYLEYCKPFLTGGLLFDTDGSAKDTTLEEEMRTRQRPDR